jgi:hypothetical protein
MKEPSLREHFELLSVINVIPLIILRCIQALKLALVT